MKRIWIGVVAFLAAGSLFSANHHSHNHNHNVDVQEGELLWMKVRATNAEERTALANKGITIEITEDDYIVALGNAEDKNIIEKEGKLLEWFVAPYSLLDFPPEDEKFHNFQEAVTEMEAIKALNSSIVELDVIGLSSEGRKIYNIRISGDIDNSMERPGIIFTGTHHAREHLSTEMPLMLARHLVEMYNAGDERIVRLVNSREINIIPIVNPDGLEWDISTGRYKMWRKNRRNNNDGTYGVDLNRNYGFGWGTGGSSSRTNSDVYMGPAPFSEPETQAVKNFVEMHDNVTILLSFHTFSELILYPWGGKNEEIGNERDRRVHQVMARKMATWNNYKPQKSSDLYIASGDTTDWSYGEHGIISFTFELDPKSMWSGGFYPGQAKIPVVFRKNLEPTLYLIDHADNPYRVLDSKNERLGFSTALF
ncbi:MAG: M14 family metallopeptidase [Bdellovibrionales bacterium]